MYFNYNKKRQSEDYISDYKTTLVVSFAAVLNTIGKVTSEKRYYHK
jgi:hypothetical protein